MFTIIKSEERQYFDAKDQLTWKTFDEENATDPLKKSFGVLKILNEELLSPGGGFVLHTKKDMVVVTYCREGVVVYKPFEEEPIIFEAKDFGKNNSEKDTNQYAFNTSESEEAHVFQCGFDQTECIDNCDETGPKPKGVKKIFTHAERQGVLKLIASSDGREASLALKDDIQIFSTFARDGNHITHELKPERSAWLHVVKGRIIIGDTHLQTGDGMGFTEEMSVSFTAKSPTEILLFDLCKFKVEANEISKNETPFVNISGQ